MGVRLVKYGVNSGAGTYNHDELKNRDLPGQHPIEAIMGLREELDGLGTRIDSANGVNAVVDTPSINLEYDTTAKSLTASVKVFRSDDNILTQKPGGMYVDKYQDLEIADTSTVHLTTMGAGETLKQMYDNGLRFSHNWTWANVYDASEANAWYYNTSWGSFVQPVNTTTFTGFVSTVQYRSYVHRATMRSTDTDNDGIGIVIAYAVDEQGRPHTLSLVFNKGGEGHVGAYYYALIYDKSLPDQEILHTKGTVTGGTIPVNNNTFEWGGATVTAEITKTGPKVVCVASNYNTTTLNQLTKIEIDLDNYAWGYLFRDKVQYGYCAQSQLNSYFQNIYFSGKGPLKANVVLSSITDNALKIEADGLYLSGEKLSGESSQFTVTQTAHGFVVGDVLYNTTTGYKKGLAVETEAVEVVGIVSKVIDANSFKLCTSGFVATTTFDSYTIGSALFLSDTLNGKLTDTEPALVSKPIATKVSGGIIVNIQRGLVADPDDTTDTVKYNIDDRIGDFKYSYDSTSIRTDGYILFKDGLSYDRIKVQELLNKASTDFIAKYILLTDTTVTFQNTDDIIDTVSYQGATPGANLYIKAFSTPIVELHTHQNKTLLDLLAVDGNGNLMYNGSNISGSSKEILWSGQISSSANVPMVWMAKGFNAIMFEVVDTTNGNTRNYAYSYCYDIDFIQAINNLTTTRINLKGDDTHYLAAYIRDNVFYVTDLTGVYLRRIIGIKY